MPDAGPTQPRKGPVQSATARLSQQEADIVVGRRKRAKRRSSDFVLSIRDLPGSFCSWLGTNGLGADQPYRWQALTLPSAHSDGRMPVGWS